MKGMLALPVLLALGVRVAGGPISHRAANKCLKEYRARMSDSAGGVVYWGWDITDEVFDWKRYLSHHPKNEELIGPGVGKFEVRFLNSRDHNKKQPICDFVVHRTDGTAARLHPSTKGPG